MNKSKAITLGSLSGAIAYLIVNTLFFKQPLIESIIGGLLIGIVSSLVALLMAKYRAKRSV